MFVILADNNAVTITDLKVFLNEIFELKDLGNLRLEIARFVKGSSLCQRNMPLNSWITLVS